MCVNQEDGFNMRVLQQTDGTQHLQAFFDDQPLIDLSALVEFLRLKPLWPVYQLRAITLVEERIHSQLEEIAGSEITCANLKGEKLVSEQVAYVSHGLRVLEKSLLEKAILVLENQKEHLLASDVVRKYLSEMQQDMPEAEEDFT